MSIDLKKIKISAVALITGNAIVDDLWQIYFPYLVKTPLVCREIMISAHSFAIMDKYLPMEDFVARVGQETKFSESSIHNSIAMLCEKKFLEKIKPDKNDARVTAVRPTQSAKKQLIDMGIEYAARMHYPLSIILGSPPSSPAALLDDINELAVFSVQDY